ncbi:MAG: SMP-30/gluconolactonase/LRE family protein, partial [Chloroflexi bacterium]|nr:SMP-30/gluconolactonase/LRE family protein [Chloroflexota bacterium]
MTGPGGVRVADSEGTPLGIIRTPVTATDIAFYGFDSRVLFITAPPAIFAIRLK